MLIILVNVITNITRNSFSKSWKCTVILQKLKFFQKVYLFTFKPFLLFSGGNFADSVFRFNANISYSGVLHAVTQDVSLISFYFSVQLGLGLKPLSFLGPGSFFWEQGEAHQQRHPGPASPGSGAPGSELRAGKPFPGHPTLGGLQGRLPGLHPAA